MAGGGNGGSGVTGVPDGDGVGPWAGTWGALEGPGPGSIGGKGGSTLA